MSFRTQLQGEAETAKNRVQKKHCAFEMQHTEDEGAHFSCGLCFKDAVNFLCSFSHCFCLGFLTLIESILPVFTFYLV